MVCERNDVYASACAVARAFSLYTKKTSLATSSVTEVSIEFIIMPTSNVNNGNTLHF